MHNNNNHHTNNGGCLVNPNNSLQPRAKPSTVSFSKTRTTVTINEEPSTTTDASPTSTSPTPTTGPSSSSPPPCSSSGQCSQADRSPQRTSFRPVNGRTELQSPVRPSVVKFSDEPDPGLGYGGVVSTYGGQNDDYVVDRFSGITIYKGHDGSNHVDPSTEKQFESYL